MNWDRLFAGRLLRDCDITRYALAGRYGPGVKERYTRNAQRSHERRAALAETRARNERKEKVRSLKQRIENWASENLL